MERRLEAKSLFYFGSSMNSCLEEYSTPEPEQGDAGRDGGKRGRLPTRAFSGCLCNLSLVLI